MSDTTDAPGTEAHGARIKFEPTEVEAHGARIKFSPETEAHGIRCKDVPETEAHGFSMSPADPALEAYARIRLSFPADAEEQTVELRYRPSQTPGEPPEVEVHRRHLR